MVLTLYNLSQYDYTPLKTKGAAEQWPSNVCRALSESPSSKSDEHLLSLSSAAMSHNQQQIIVCQ